MIAYLILLIGALLVWLAATGRWKNFLAAMDNPKG